MKIGVFGGTFDPIHIGHLLVADEARARLDLDEVVFVPTGQPWLKAERKITKGIHRMAMTQLAVASNPFFWVSDMEIARSGPTYTVDTLVELREGFGLETALYVILGLDSLRELARWHRPEGILELSTVVGMARPGFQDFDPRTLDAISPDASAKVVLLDGPLTDVSGSELRRRVVKGQSIKYRVPESVEAYIYEHGLYRK